MTNQEDVKLRKIIYFLYDIRQAAPPFEACQL